MKRLLGALVALVALSTLSCVADKITPPPKLLPPGNPAEFIDHLASAYHNHDFASFAALLSSEPGATFVFLLEKPTLTGEMQWGLDEELRIHRRMFDPQHPALGELPVADDLWVDAITILLTPEGSFVDRDDLGLDPTRWKASEAVYGAQVLFDLTGPIDYAVDSREDFIVLEDLAKSVGEPGKFTLYRWQGLDPPTASRPSGVEATTWGSIKQIYR